MSYRVVKLRNISPHSLSLYRPPGDPGALTVEPGQTVEVRGVIATEQPQGDAVIVDDNGELRAWSTVYWELADGPPEISPVTPTPGPVAIDTTEGE